MLNKMNFENYTDYLLSVNIAQISREFGFKKIGMNSLYLITNILRKFIEKIAIETQNNAENSNRYETNLIDCLYSLVENDIHLNDISSYLEESKIKYNFSKEKYLDKIYLTEEKERINHINKINSNIITDNLNINKNILDVIPQQFKYFPKDFSTIKEENKITNKQALNSVLHNLLDENKNRKRSNSFNERKTLEEINNASNYFDMSKKHIKKKNGVDIKKVLNDIEYEEGDIYLGKKIIRDEDISNLGVYKK